MIGKLLTLLPPRDQLRSLESKNCHESDEMGLSELWQRLHIPKPPLWQSLAGRVFRPLECAFDKVFECAVRTIPFVEEERDGLEITSLLPLKVLRIGQNLASSERIACEWSAMSPDRLTTCLAAVDWTREDFAARFNALGQQIKHLDPHIAPKAMTRPQPQWMPDPQVCEYIGLARSIAERIDRDLPYTQEIPTHALTCEQLGDLSIGLELLNVNFEIKQIERWVMRYVKRCRLAKTIAKIGLFAPPILMLVLPKFWPLQLSLPLLGLLCLGGARQLCIGASDQSLADLDRQEPLTWLFTDVTVLAYRNYHAENARRQQRAANERAEKAQRRADDLAAQLAQERVRRKAAEAKSAELDRKIEALQERGRQINEIFTWIKRYSAEIQALAPYADQLHPLATAGYLQMRDGRVHLAPHAIQSLLGLSLSAQHLYHYKRLTEPEETKCCALQVLRCE